MKKIQILLFVLLLSSVGSLKGQENTWREIPYFLDNYKKEYKMSPREATLSWFKDARYGLFIHWGPAVQYEAGEWVMYNQRIPINTYEKKCRDFKGNKFDAKFIVKLAKDAQMEYITFVAKHHDGFAMWGTKTNKYNSLDYPSGRDFVKELAEECRKEKIALFIYYSIGIDWHHPYFMPNTMYDPARPHYADEPARYKYKEVEDFKHYINFAKTQIMELATMYGPIAGFWFDTVGGIYEHPDMFNIQEIYDMIHAIQPHALVTFKTGANGNEDFITGERHMGSLSPVFKSVGLSQEVQDSADRSWESNKNKPAELNTTLQNAGWGYHKNNTHKNANEVLELLNHCAKMNANLLLNIGPKPNGEVIDENVKVLLEVGETLKKNGFPKLNKKDYMLYRENKIDIKDDLEENQTAR